MAAVQYQLTKRELVFTGTVRLLARTRLLVALGLLFIAAIASILIGDSYTMLGWVFLVLALLFPLILARAVQRIVSANPVLTSKITMNFDDRGIVSVSEGYRSERAWSSFFGWSHSEKYFFLRVDKLGTPITIPKRAFTETQLEMFFDHLAQIGGNRASSTNET
jgi:hypothetical protein